MPAPTDLFVAVVRLSDHLERQGLERREANRRALDRYAPGGDA